LGILHLPVTAVVTTVEFIILNYSGLNRYTLNHLYIKLIQNYERYRPYRNSWFISRQLVTSADYSSQHNISFQVH
jgi:hypothetical protein